MKTINEVLEELSNQINACIDTIIYYEKYICNNPNSRFIKDNKEALEYYKNKLGSLVGLLNFITNN